MIKLSVVIITYNEEKNISRCLDSVQSLADEIIVVDSGSSDRTKEICLSYGANVFEHPFEGHIEQKNYAVALASYDYVLSLDADECLSAELRESIVFVKSYWHHEAYAFNRLTNYCGQFVYHCGWYPDTKLRLFNRRIAKWGGTNPHDKIIPDAHIRVAKLKGDLLHYSFYTQEEHMKQIHKFMYIKAEGLYKKGKKSSWVKRYILPIVKFFISYCIKLGFLDGYYGFVICRNSAYAVYLKYFLLHQMHRKATV